VPYTTRKITVGTLVAEKREEWNLELVGGREGLDKNMVVTPDINRPGMALVGFTGVFLRERIQIVGSTELTYLATLDEKTASADVRRVFDLEPVCILVAKGLELAPVWKKEADRCGVPLLRTPMDTTPFIHRLTGYLDYRLAPEDKIHGDLVDVFGVGMLITGQSGIGKSECALDLVDRGHRLIPPPSSAITSKSGASAWSMSTASTGSAPSGSRSGSRSKSTSSTGSPEWTTSGSGSRTS
jgi:HPr kinase/phosphorylase